MSADSKSDAMPMLAELLLVHKPPAAFNSASPAPQMRLAPGNQRSRISDVSAAADELGDVVSSADVVFFDLPT